MYADTNSYLGAVIDSDYVASIVGSLRGERRDDRIDVNHQPRSWAGVFPGPLKVSFPQFSKADSSKAIPDIAEFQGRLFLNEKACSILQPLIGEDGEFLPAIYEGGNGYIFTPLRVAEDVDGLDQALSRKNDWGDVEHLVFDEQKVDEWSVFRCEFTAFVRLYCQESVKDVIEAANLTGLYITNDLANIFPEEKSAVFRLN
ncbi:hypothetical protein Q2E61_10360 [Microbulbifer thermotolerans]|uniref:hypothetical protein n=1 Tax=Microbulbifer thermotolerans TaxID=252514 RepID=UPI002673BF7F|nr:hypothetical protein [Microbulbifer thermotolerans]WKT59317.1 hypothetical protein Q2E61_10360 [Microbulbifer thermotolerans]